jgi:type II secretory pathway component PulF
MKKRASSKKAPPSHEEKKKKEKKLPVRRERSAFVRRLARIGTAKERNYVVEQMSMLAGSGMPIISALRAIREALRIKAMRVMVDEVIDDIESGAPLWRALEKTRFFAPHTISLIRVGEESGKLAENLSIVAEQDEKDRSFRSKVRSALMYPVFVLSLTLVVGIGVAWFILPKLAQVFSDLHVELPKITQILIYIGNFLGAYGHIVIPAGGAVLFVFFYFLFFFPKTKRIGQFFLFFLPGTKDLVQQSELARFGYLLGTLLDAGLVVTHALETLAYATIFPQYRRFFEYLHTSVGDGNSLEKSFAGYPHAKSLVPTPIQQLIISGEQSGRLSETLHRVGKVYEAKLELTTKNLAVILEPVLLVIVWLGVLAVALSVILPVYSLIGGLNQ